MEAEALPTRTGIEVQGAPLEAFIGSWPEEVMRARAILEAATAAEAWESLEAPLEAATSDEAARATMHLLELATWKTGPCAAVAPVDLARKEP